MRKKGFTLVEILIALAILAVIVTSTFVIFRSSTESWQKGEKRSERYHNARVAVGKMSTEISQAVVSGNKRSKFIGNNEEVGFVSFVSTAEGIFELVEIEYWLDKDGRFLMRNEDIDPDFDFLTQDNSDILAENITLLEFSYYDGLTWNDTWNLSEDEEDGEEEIEIDESVLPKAVKIKIKVSMPEQKEILAKGDIIMSETQAEVIIEDAI